MKFEGKSPLGNTIDLDMNLAVVDFGLLYNVADRRMVESDARIALDAYVRPERRATNAAS